MMQTSETAGAKLSLASAASLADDPMVKNSAAVVFALNQAFIDGLQFVNRTQLVFWFGHLERVWGVGRPRSAPPSTEENFFLQAEYVHTILRAHVLAWSRLPAPSSEIMGPGVEVAPTQQRRAA